MTCPTCNGPLKMLFTSSYCEACERKGESVHAKVRTASGSLAYALTSDTWTLDVTAPRILCSDDYAAVVERDWSNIDNDDDEYRERQETAKAAAERVRFGLASFEAAAMDGFIDTFDRCMVKGPGGRRCVGYDGKVREWRKVYSCVQLGRAYDPALPPVSVAIDHGKAIAKYITEKVGAARNVAHLNTSPVKILGSWGDGVRIHTDQHGQDHAFVIFGSYYCALDGDQP